MADEKKTGLFEKGGKLYWLHSTIDAFDTFLRVPGTVTTKGAHVRDGIDLKRVMIMVVIALVPAALFGMYNVGLQTSLTYGLDWGFWRMFFYGLLRMLPLFVVSYLVGLAIEFASSQIRGEEVNEGYLVTGFLIPLIVPVIGMVAIMTFVANFNAFDVVFAMETLDGAPDYSTDLIGMLFYRYGVAGQHPVGIPEPGVGSAISTSIFAMLLCGVIPTLIKTQGKE